MQFKGNCERINDREVVNSLYSYSMWGIEQEIGSMLIVNDADIGYRLICHRPVKIDRNRYPIFS